MKRMFILFLVAIISAISISPNYGNASSTTNDKAIALNKLTLLQGNGTDFNLTGELKRSEAVTFIIRILGQESYVKENQNKYEKTSFSDVKSSDWYAASVGYCVEQSIVNGYPNGEFRPNEVISEKAFLKLVLSAMGYKIDTDFTWSNIYAFAFTVGLVSDVKYQTQSIDNLKYKREDVVNVLYNSLTLSGLNKPSILEELLSKQIVDKKMVVQLGLMKDSIPTIISSLDVVSSTSLAIKFNEGAKNLSIQNILIYESDNKANVLSATIEKQDDQLITLKTSEQKADQAYTIEVTNILDVNGKQYPNLSFAFKGFIPTKIVSVIVPSETKIEVNLNKAIKPIQVSDLQIYEKGNPTNILTFSIESQTDKSIKLKTATQKQTQGYSLVFKGTESNSGGALTLNSEFTGYLLPEIKSDYFKISKVVSVSQSIINVYYTQPVNGIAALPIFYEVFKDNVSYVKGTYTNMAAKQIPGQTNLISIYLKDRTITTDSSYKIVVTGDVSSNDGVRLNDGLGDSAAFTSNSAFSPGLSVISVNPIDSRTLRVEFSKELDQASAQTLSNYSVINANGVTNPVIRAVISKDGNGKVLLIQVVDPIDSSSNHQFIIKNVMDNFGVLTLPETKLLFNGQGIAATKDTKILFSSASDKLTVQVYFDQILNDTAIINAAYYSITGVTDPSFSTIPASVYYDPKDPKKVILSLPLGKELVQTSSYKISVSKFMATELGNISSANAEFTFVGSADSNVKPFLLEAKVIGKNLIRIKSQKPILTNGSNILASNYALETKDANNTVTSITPSSIVVIDGYTLTMNFSSLDISKIYTLRFATLTDSSGLNVRTSADGTTSIGVTVGR